MMLLLLFKNNSSLFVHKNHFDRFVQFVYYSNETSKHRFIMHLQCTVDGPVGLTGEDARSRAMGVSSGVIARAQTQDLRFSGTIASETATRTGYVLDSAARQV